MTINAANITPGRAIKNSLVLLKGALELAKEGDTSALMSIYYEGEPGVGKSAIGRAIARELNYKFVDRRANMMNPDDAAGTRMQDMETKQTAWFPPEWMPAENGDVDGVCNDKTSPHYGKPYAGTLLFFDELASADDRVRKPLFGVFLDREINGRPLPHNCIVMAAGNEAETGTLVFELDNATRTRFITMRIIADFQSWEQDYAPNAGITPTTVSYLKQNMHRFCETVNALENNRTLYGNPRSWEHCSNAERAIMRTPEDRNDEDKKEALATAIAGKVGHEIAGEFMGVFDSVANMSNLYDLLRATKEQRKKMWPSSIGQLYALTYSMMAYPSTIEDGKKVVDLSKEMAEEKSALPLAEMQAPVLEVIIKRLKGINGIKQADVSKAFQSDSNATSDEILAAGPLIKL